MARCSGPKGWASIPRVTSISWTEYTTSCRYSIARDSCCTTSGNKEPALVISNCQPDCLLTEPTRCTWWTAITAESKCSSILARQTRRQELHGEAQTHSSRSRARDWHGRVGATDYWRLPGRARSVADRDFINQGRLVCRMSVLPRATFGAQPRNPSLEPDAFYANVHDVRKFDVHGQSHPAAAFRKREQSVPQLSRRHGRAWT